MYSQAFWEHVRNPRNRGGHPLGIPDALVGESRYHRCGDRLTLYLQIQDGRIAQASFEARACAPVIAVASLGTERLTGLTPIEARELPILELDKELGGLPPSKRHAYLLLLECLKNALDHHEQRKLHHEKHQNHRHPGTSGHVEKTIPSAPPTKGEPIDQAQAQRAASQEQKIP